MTAAFLPAAAKPVTIGSCTLGTAPVKVISSIMEADEEAVLKRQAALEREALDLLEWRADYFVSRKLMAFENTAKLLQKKAKKPVIFTMRTAAEGGQVDLTARDYKEVGVIIAKNGGLPAIDVEIARGLGALRILGAAHESNMAVIASYHNFHETPSEKDLSGIFARMDAAGADVLKVATMPQTPEDVLTVMIAALKARRDYGRPVIAMAMGPLGVVTRTCGALFGSDATFAAVGKPSAPGQVSLSELRRMLSLFAGSTL